RSRPQKRNIAGHSATPKCMDVRPESFGFYFACLKVALYSRLSCRMRRNARDALVFTSSHLHPFFIKLVTHSWIFHDDTLSQGAIHMMIGSQRSKRRRSGVAAVETAVMLIPVFTILMGLWEVSRFIEAQQVLMN